MKIGIDIMGGDFAPLEAIKGIQQYFQEAETKAHLFLLGDEEKAVALAAEHSISKEDYTIVHAP